MLVLYADALAVGIASVILSFIGGSTQTIVTIMGIGILCLAVAGLNSLER